MVIHRSFCMLGRSKRPAEGPASMPDCVSGAADSFSLVARRSFRLMVRRRRPLDRGDRATGGDRAPGPA
jgi:hypothetical protein